MHKISFLKQISAFILICISASVYSQNKEGNNWLFGNRAGMTWNTTQNLASVPILNANGQPSGTTKPLNGLPTPLAGSVMSQSEGVFCMSDPNGKLLFYSSGMIIWNSNHQQMSNGTGLSGGISSTQSGIIIPHPGQSNQYIAFAIAERPGNALTYSIVDMTLNGGLGNVVANAKNIPLTGVAGSRNEEVVAVKKTNSNGYWLIAFGKGSGANSTINVWDINASGVQTACLHSYTLPVSTASNDIGYLRFTADGKHFAWPMYIDKNLLVGNFDPATGIVSNVKNFSVSHFNGAYGAEFSPSNEILYVAETDQGNNLYAYKFAELLSQTNYNNVTRKTINMGTNLGALQLASDGRIYGAIRNNADMLVIDNIDDFNNFTVHRISGLIPSGTNNVWGLPNFPPNIFAPVDNTCPYFTDDIWYFGMGGGGIAFNTDSNGDKVAVNATGESLVSSAENSLSVSSPGCGSSLIFYSQHDQLYNALHQPMANGTFTGHQSVADGLAACYIGNNQYMVFSVTHAYEESTTMALQFHIIDMTEDGGYGRRMSTTTIESSGMSESVELIPVPGTSNEYWLVYNMYQANEIRVRKVTGNSVSGVLRTLSMSTHGVNGLSYMLKANASYNMLALTYPSGRLALFDFDTNSGKIDVRTVVSTPLAPGAFYGIEFSPNGQYVYCTTYNINMMISQYNISAGTFTTPFTYAGTNGGGLKMGPDGKLYVKRYGRYMGVIENPDAPLTQAGYNQNGFDLGLGVNSTGLTFSTGLTPPAECPSGLNQAPIAVDDTVAVFHGYTFCIPVMANDYDPNPGDSLSLVNVFFLNEADTAKVSVSFNLGDSTICITPKAAAQIGDSIFLSYTIRDNANPIKLCADAKVRIRIHHRPDNIVDEENCFILAPSFDFTIKQQWATNGVDPHSGTLVGDLDGDGLPEIIAYSFDMTKIRIFNGQTGAEKAVIDVGASGGSGGWRAHMTAVLVDADRNGKAEIIVARTTPLASPSLISYEAVVSNGQFSLTQKWTRTFTNVTANVDNLPQPIVADFNGDSIPELVVYNQILNARTGVVLGQTEAIGTAHKGCDPGRLSNWNRASNFQTTADFDGDGLPELVAGGKVYKVVVNAAKTGVTCSILKQANTANGYSINVPDGFTSVADIDMDGNLDVVVASTSGQLTSLYVWSPMTKWAIKKDIYTSTSGYPAHSFPFIGDIDGVVNSVTGKKHPEICLVTSRENHNSGGYVWAYKYNATTKNIDQKWRLETSDKSGGTGITLFDFNNDGKSELVYRDETHLRILDGSADATPVLALPAGANPLFPAGSQFNCLSGTALEYPVIADTDGDGSANICVTCYETATSTAATSYLRVYEGATNAWAPTRTVWNQVSYEPLQINENLTVPVFPMPKNAVFNGKYPYNGALIQVPTMVNSDFSIVTLAADPAVNKVWAERLNMDSVRIWVRIDNLGVKNTNASLPVALYGTYPPPATANGTHLQIKPVGANITPGNSYEMYFDLPVLNLPDVFSVRIQDDGTKYPAGGSYLDCNYNNNTGRLSSLLAVDDKVVAWGPTDINVLANDLFGACERGSSLEAAIITGTGKGPFHGTVSFNPDSTVKYNPNVNYLGLDTFEYYIKCGTDIDTATVIINVIEKPDNINEDDCFVDPEAKTFTIREAITFPNAHTMSTPLVADLNGDGSPEIIVPRMFSAGQPWYSNGFVIANVSANTSREILTVNFSTHGQSVAIADVDKDGTAEIFVQSAVDSRIYCYNPTGAGSAKAGFTTTVATNEHYIISIADINNDGIPELIAGPYIFNARTGALILQMVLEPDGNAFGNPHSLVKNGGGGLAYNGYYYMPVVGDIDGDGVLEIAAGSTIYHPNITNPNNTTGNTYTKKKVITAGQPASFRNYLNGPTVLVDFDKDGQLDVCVLGYSSTTITANSTAVTVQFYAWNPRTQEVIGHAANTITSPNFTIPYVGDLDGNGYPDFAFATGLSTVGMTSYQYNKTEATKVKQGPVKPAFAETAGFTLFDFNQDGKSEIVYRGNSQFFIVDGATLNNVSSPTPAWSGTVAEYPIVADVDNDGQAEIILTRAFAQWNGSNNMQGVLAVYKSNNSAEPWAPARKVWNQWAYNSVYINEDMSVPKRPINPATIFPGKDELFDTSDDIQPFNGFLMQQTLLSKYGAPVFLTPDAVIDASLSSSSVSGNSVTVTVGIINDGDAILGPPIYVTLYRNSISTANILKTDSGNIQIHPGDTGYVTVTIPDITIYNPAPVNIIVRINDNGVKFPYQPECKDNNNEMTILNPALSLLMKKEATLNSIQENGSYPNPVSVLYNENIEYKITAVNANLNPNTTVIIRDTLPPYMKYISSPATPPVTTGSDGGSPTRTTLTWSISGLASMATTSVYFTATPEPGVSASQPLFINRAWITASDTIKVPTNSTFHQGAGISITTFSAGFGGQIYNAGEQALDYMTSPSSGIIIVPEEGYRFAGWSHNSYVSLRGKNIETKTDIMHYDTLIIYGNVELHANFEIERYPVRYRLNGSNNAKENPETYSIESGTITLEAPVKDNDVFVGWTGSNGEEPQHIVFIPQGSTGEREYYANFLNSGREDEAKKDDLGEDKIWAVKDELFVRTSKAGNVVRIYSTEGVLQKVHTIVTTGETKIKLAGGIYFVTLNNGTGQTVRIE